MERSLRLLKGEGRGEIISGQVLNVPRILYESVLKKTRGWGRGRIDVFQFYGLCSGNECDGIVINSGTPAVIHRYMYIRICIPLYLRIVCRGGFIDDRVNARNRRQYPSSTQRVLIAIVIVIAINKAPQIRSQRAVYITRGEINPCSGITCGSRTTPSPEWEWEWE